MYRRDRALNDTLKSFGLLATEWRTLGTLLRQGPLSMQDLAQWTAYERTRLTRMLDGMEGKGWVERTESDSDGRSIVVRLAPKGEKLYRRAEAVVEPLTNDIMSVCPEADVARVRRSLQAVRKKLIEMNY